MTQRELATPPARPWEGRQTPPLGGLALAPLCPLNMQESATTQVSHPQTQVPGLVLAAWVRPVGQEGLPREGPCLGQWEATGKTS